MKLPVKKHGVLQDVHDRALFYYRLLQHNISIAERVVNPPKQAVSVFADTQSGEIKDRIFDEFNSLSVVYQKVPGTALNLTYLPSYSMLCACHSCEQICMIVQEKDMQVSDHEKPKINCLHVATKGRRAITCQA